MIAPHQLRREIELSLRQATDDQLVRVMAFIDRLPGRTQVEDLVEAIRSRLALVRPSRPITIPRILTLPIEDLLSTPSAGGDSKWLMPRALLVPAHRIILSILPNADLQRYERMAGKRNMDDEETVLEIGNEVWPRGAEALRECLANPVEPALEDWREEYSKQIEGMALILEHAAEILVFLNQLPPKPMGRLREDEEGAALSLLYSTRFADEDLFRYCYTMLMRRSSEPSEIFHLVLDNDFEMPTGERDRIVREAAGECLMEIDAINKTVDEDTEGSVVTRAETTNRLVSLIESLEKAPPAAGLDAKRLAATKAKASRTIVRTFETTLDGEMRRTFAQLSERRNATDEDVATAETVARSTRKVELAGVRLGLAGALETVLDRELGAYREMLARKLQSIQGAPAAQLAGIMDELRLVEIVFGADTALDLLREIRGEAPPPKRR